MKLELIGAQVDSLRALLGWAVEEGDFNGSFATDLENMYNQILEKEKGKND